MNICLFTNTYLPHVGGVAKSVAILAEDLTRMGHQVLVIAPTFADDLGEQSDHDFAVVRLPAIQHFNGSDFSVRLPIPFQLTETMDEFSPDLIHSHHPFLLGDTALRIARSYQIPLVFTHHTLYERYTHYVPLDSASMEKFAINLAVAYCNLCDAVVAPSESIATLIKDRGTESPVTVIPTGVDLNFFKQGSAERFNRQYRLSTEVTVIGHVGRLAEEKNLVYLANAMASVLQRNANYCFLLVGDGPIKNSLTDLFQEAGVSDQVITTGTCAGQDLADAYAAMDLFVFTSHTETQGMVVTEAMAAANPVVALDASGVREVVKHGENGLLLRDSTSIDDFAEATAELCEARQRREHLAEGAKNTALTMTREQSARKMITLYQSLTYQDLSEHNYQEKLSLIDKIAGKLKAEWELLSEKGRAAARTVSEIS